MRHFTASIQAAARQHIHQSLFALNLLIAAALLVALTPTTALSNARSHSADEILKRADEVRNPSDSFAMVVDIKSTGVDDARFEVMLKGKDKTLIRTKQPSRDVGRNILMLEQNMWAYVPNLKRAVRISLNQKLTGQAANGDISRMRWHGDYDAKIERKDGDDWVLDLKATKKGLTYDRIRVWVRQNNHQPQKAEYLTTQSKVLKVVTFGGYRELLGAPRPTEITIRDANDRSKSSQIIIREMRSEDFPASLFNQNSLK
jgi:outer membrane lipoprotein-sorting protein